MPFEGCSGTARVLMVLVVLGLLLVECGAGVSSKQAPTLVSVRTVVTRNLVREVPDAEGHTREQLEQLARQREPFVIRHSSLATQASLSKWTPADIASALSTVPAYAQRGSGRFRTFHDDKELEPFLRHDHWTDFNVKVNVSTGQLFDTVARDAGRFLYFSADVNKLGPHWPALEDLLPDRDAMAQSATGLQSNLWLGHGGLVTAMHYDASWNFFLQLHGRKQFTLLRPGAPVCPYPCLHPSIAHAQWDPLGAAAASGSAVCMADPDVLASENQGRGSPVSTTPQRLADVAAVWQVTLGPSDLLYVPPHWWHEVATLKDSVSFNVWTDAPEYVMIHDIYALPIPLEGSWDGTKLRQGAMAYLRAIHEALHLDFSFAASLRHLLAQRWSPLEQAQALHYDPFAVNAALRACLSLQTAATSTPGPTLLTDTEKSRLDSRATAAAAQMATLHREVQLTLMHNYIERVLSLAAVKEGGKKGQDLAGLYDMGGVSFFHVVIEAADGELSLVEHAMTGANKEVDEGAEDRKGGSGHVAKCFLSANKDQVAGIFYVPASLAEKLTAKAWFERLNVVLGGEIVEETEETIKVIAKGDPAAEKFPLKIRDEAINAGFSLLREKQLVPEDDDDSDYDYEAAMEENEIEW
ncbi:uncharacterized protein MONBRDRAFT_30745 [Monosiga brevicollis MX1]|uniref:JmjC domain-containing protein n=1 Tax=Monosiga brevicollis TaxID=81824 RepID=A9UNY3_MONBE|nr:uncharacterized protein MONBRDRAFT_30745 [Monosiga brevicollis MX1]EDQ92780.1 predicted protein [Monosiga brevicollis MX1]|eukprot:XP_001742542.1 hypothetical protein [Monosiga brevicollis MX1]